MQDESKSSSLFEAIKYVMTTYKDEVHEFWWSYDESESFFDIDDTGKRYFWLNISFLYLVQNYLIDNGLISSVHSSNQQKLIDNYKEWSCEGGKYTDGLLAIVCYVNVSGNISEYIFKKTCDKQGIKHIDYVNDEEKQMSGVDCEICNKQDNCYTVQTKTCKSKHIFWVNNEIQVAKFNVAYVRKDQREYDIVNIVNFDLKRNEKLVQHYNKYVKGYVDYNQMLDLVIDDADTFKFKGMYTFTKDDSRLVTENRKNYYVVSTDRLIKKLTYEIK